LSDDLSCGTGVNCQEHEEKTWLKHKNVNLFSNDRTIIDHVYWITIFQFLPKIFSNAVIWNILRHKYWISWENNISMKNILDISYQNTQLSFLYFF